MFGKLMSAGKQALASQAGGGGGAPAAGGAPNPVKTDLRSSFQNMLQGGQVKDVLANLTPENKLVAVGQAHSQLPTEAPASTCAGNKKSLFIGINYPGTKAELRGCIEDVKNIKDFIVRTFNFPTDADHMRTLTDDNQASLPTRANIIAGIQWLVAGAREGDSLFLHYSGHGAQVQDTDGDELEGKDEALCPSDYESAGFITDDELHNMLVKDLPKGVRLTSIFDCCHSGSILDLPFTYCPTGNIVEEVDNRKALIDAAMKAGSSLFAGDKAGAIASGKEAVKLFMAKPAPAGASDQRNRVIQLKSTVCDSISFSGCRDEQTSADATIGQKPSGAMSWAFINAYKPGITYTQLLGEVRKLLEGKFHQVPQMSAGRRLNLSVPYIM